MLEVGQDLHNLAQILRMQPLDQRLADYIGKELIQGLDNKLDRQLRR